MAGKNQWVVPTEDGWGVRGEGNTHLSSRHRTQADAIAAATNTAAAASEVIILGHDDRIRERNSYEALSTSRVISTVISRDTPFLRGAAFLRTRTLIRKTVTGLEARA